MKRWIAAAALLALPVSLHAQSLNIDFGPPGSAPASSYAGVGLAGTWNNIGVLTQFVRAPLVGLNGQPIAAKIYMFGGTDMLAADDPATSGDDEALLDDMLLSYCAPVDGCVWIEDLQLGDYIVITYAMTPNAPALMSPVRVDFATPGSMPVGGSWSGTHGLGVTYARHTVTTYSNGKVAAHSGTYAGYFQAGINGIQLISMADALGLDSSPAIGNSLRLRGPNPASGDQALELALASGIASGEFEITDVAGRRVWTAPAGRRAAGSHATTWNGRGLDGSRVPAGIYFARVRAVGEDGAPIDFGPLRLVRVR